MISRRDLLKYSAAASTALTLDLRAALGAGELIRRRIPSTGEALPIIGLGMVERATRARRRRPIFMVDLAVPRDIEQEVARLDDVFLYTVDDLGALVQSGHENRRAAVAQAEAIIETRVDTFMQWLATRVSMMASACATAARRFSCPLCTSAPRSSTV